MHSRCVCSHEKWKKNANNVASNWKWEWKKLKSNWKKGAEKESPNESPLDAIALNIVVKKMLEMHLMKWNNVYVDEAELRRCNDIMKSWILIPKSIQASIRGNNNNNKNQI